MSRFHLYRIQHISHVRINYFFFYQRTKKSIIPQELQSTCSNSFCHTVTTSKETKSTPFTLSTSRSRQCTFKIFQIISNLPERVTRTRRAPRKLIDWFYIRFERNFKVVKKWRRKTCSTNLVSFVKAFDKGIMEHLSIPAASPKIP